MRNAKGEKGYWQGKNRVKETKDKISKTLNGRKLSKKHRIHIGKASEGRHQSNTSKLKISKGHKGEKNGNFGKKGELHHNFGKHWDLSEKTKEKIKVYQQTHTNSGRFKKGEAHYNWHNGSSFEPYSVDWTDDLRRAIRKRDKYTCQMCGKEPAIQVHHIDYDKKNCNPDNLITLCKRCHSKTNTKRDYWIKYFKKIMKKTKKHEICEICEKEILGEPIYFEDGWLIHPEDENPECMKEAERRDAEISPSK